MKEKIYISGKISGLEFEDAYKKFMDAQLKYESAGFEVVNPMRIAHDHDLTWESYMKADLKAMLDCTHIFMLKDWHTSRGADIEYNLAKELSLIVIFE
jgi:hypothetical protein